LINSLIYGTIIQGSDSMQITNLREAGKRTNNKIPFILDDYELPDNLKEL